MNPPAVRKSAAGSGTAGREDRRPFLTFKPDRKMREKSSFPLSVIVMV